MKPIKWNEENNKVLEKLYNNYASDKDIANYFNSTEYAVAKQRSKLGLKKYSRTFAHRKPKEKVEEFNSYIAVYKDEDGMQHMMVLEKEDSNSVDKATKLLYGKRIKEVTILKPYKKLIRQGVTEVKL